MRRVERWKPNVLAQVLRHRRPVVGKRDLRPAVGDRAEVVTPDPATKLEIAVTGDILAGLPRNRYRRNIIQDFIRHLVVTVRVVVVMHRHSEDLTGAGDTLSVERLTDPACP